MYPNNNYYVQPTQPHHTIGQKIDHAIDHLTGKDHHHHQAQAYIPQPVYTTPVSTVGYAPVYQQPMPSHGSHHGHHGGHHGGHHDGGHHGGGHHGGFSGGHHGGFSGGHVGGGHHGGC